MAGSFLKRISSLLGARQPQPEVSARSVDEEFECLLDDAKRAYDSGNDVDALELYRRASELKPEQLKPHEMLGYLYLQRGNHIKARAHLQCALEISPSSIDGLYFSSVIAVGNGDVDLARKHLQHLLELEPDHIHANKDLALILWQEGSQKAAFELLETAIVQSPNAAVLHLYLGNFYLQSFQAPLALKAYQEVVRCGEHSPEIYYSLGATCVVLGLAAEAKAYFQRVLEMSPQHVSAHFELALLYLQSGDYEDGWREFEWRWELPSLKPHRFRSKSPRWDGKQSLVGRKLLVLSEQGFGDTIQFCRFIPLLRQSGAEVVFVALKPLIGLMAQIENVSELLDEQTALPEYDFYCELMSLPYLLGLGFADVPAPSSYLKADADVVKEWSSKLSGMNGRKRVGIVWAGNSQFAKNHTRSISFAAWRQLFDLNLDFVVLQKEISSDDRADIGTIANVTMWSDDLRSFADTAALIEALDLVVTVDTSVAHLAAAMGKPTWILISHHPDWRWLLERTDSPWYPSVRLFRQQALQTWESVLSDVKAELKLLEDSK